MDVRRDNPEATPREPTIISTDDARQGVTGNNVRYVLGFGTVVLFSLIYLYYFAL